MAGDDDFEFAKSVNEQAIQSSNSVLRALLTIHGGSAIALLAFIGSLAGREKVNLANAVMALRQPLELFGWGVALTVVAMMLAYFTNYATVGHAFAAQGSVEEKHYGWIKTVCHGLAILTAFASLSLFLCAVHKVSVAVTLISF